MHRHVRGAILFLAISQSSWYFLWLRLQMEGLAVNSDSTVTKLRLGMSLELKTDWTRANGRGRTTCYCSNLKFI